MRVQIADRGWLLLSLLWAGLAIAGIWDKSLEVVFLRLNLSLTSALLAFSTPSWR